MNVLLIGATGTIGSEIAKALPAGCGVIPAGRNAGIRVEISDPQSIRAMYREAGPIDAVVCAAGSAAFAPLAQLSDADFQLSLTSKLMGQVNLVRFGIDTVRDGGSFTLTSGVLAEQPVVGSAAVSLVNAGIQGFVLAAALEMPRGIRINAVSPGWVSETLAAMGQDPAAGVPARDVAKAYVQAIEGGDTGRVIRAATRDEAVERIEA
jgi:NAD(P)-dependent dehydrogenase (short-subunit alcohol dehydrogenase family)